jgi:hypothetical protein
MASALVVRDAAGADNDDILADHSLARSDETVLAHGRVHTVGRRA